MEAVTGGVAVDRASWGVGACMGQQTGVCACKDVLNTLLAPLPTALQMIQGPMSPGWQQFG